MTEVPIDLQALMNRLEKVERQYRHLKTLGTIDPYVLINRRVQR